MFVILPFYLAVGFCVGFLWTFRYSLRVYFNDTPRMIVVACIAGGIGIFIVSSFGPFLGTSGPKGTMLAAAGVGVGVVAGRWFRSAISERDKLVLIAASGLFLMLWSTTSRFSRGSQKLARAT